MGPKFWSRRACHDLRWPKFQNFKTRVVFTFRTANCNCVIAWRLTNWYQVCVNNLCKQDTIKGARIVLIVRVGFGVEAEHDCYVINIELLYRRVIVTTMWRREINCLKPTYDLNTWELALFRMAFSWYKLKYLHDNLVENRSFSPPWRRRLKSEGVISLM